MNKKTVGLALLSLTLAAGCTRLSEQQTVRVVSARIIAELPPIEYPPPPELRPVEYDVPRDLSQPRTVRNTEDCRSVPEARRTSEYWTRCGIHPPLTNSNIFMGVDLANWEIMQENWLRLQTRERMWQSRVDEVNRQRQEARERAQQENP